MLEITNPSETACWHLRIQGVVQGVGFRPFVYRLARTLGLAGWVQNSPDGVTIVVEGQEEFLSRFFQRLYDDAPASAHVANVERVLLHPQGIRDFVILPSQNGRNETGLPPDLATCPQCLEEVFSSQDRRFHYPFANCTQCGPRFTITCTLPYDRATTTMVDFVLCAACQAEYQTPADRRFHAEPIACPRCGPHVWLKVGAHLSSSQEDAFSHAAQLVRQGGIIAIQGLGGFHLACDATNEAAVHRLRQVKDRLEKPLAIMLESLAQAHRYGQPTQAEVDLLTSPQAPIVLVRKQSPSALAPSIAPDNPSVGMMLPYTPLHHILLRKVGRPLVMTSGNRRDEPLCKTAGEAETELAPHVDAFLLHNRPIHQRCDDSVFVVTETGPQPIRRSRGYVPFPIPLPFTSSAPVLAVGAELKNTFCLLHESNAFPSQYIGDVSSLATQRHFTEALESFESLLNINPQVVAHDFHPEYATTHYAAALGLPQVGVQHHHAHIASCMADNLISEPVIGVAFDGTGYGADGAIWGGEFMVADFQQCERIAHFEYLPLPGGDAAIRHPARIAIAYLLALLGKLPNLPFLKDVAPADVRLIPQLVNQRINTPLTSSCGRLFDAVAALLGLRQDVTYEAQAAIALEAASETITSDPPPYSFHLDGQQIRLGSLFSQMVEEIQHEVPIAMIGRRFHATVSEIVHSVCHQIREQRGLSRVALSGGCWQNRLLLSITLKRLRASGFDVYTHHQVPANDGGISLGQAAVAAARINGPQV